VTAGCLFFRNTLLIDVVMFSGERDLLEARLRILEADLTIVFEGDRTFTGQSRQLVGVGDLPVIYVPVATETNDDPWLNEYAQRRAGFAALKELNIPGDATVGLFDVDEIPDPVKIREPHSVSVWMMRKYQMSARWFQREEQTGVSGLYSDLYNLDVAQVRRFRDRLPVIVGGWHFSSFLDLDGLVKKWMGFSHTEFQRPDIREWISECWRDGIAIENGQLLPEIALTGLPAGLNGGPDFWFRQRPL